MNIVYCFPRQNKILRQKNVTYLIRNCFEDTAYLEILYKNILRLKKININTSEKSVL